MADKETKISPAMCVFGREIRDFIPVLHGKYKPHPTWRSTLAKREEALRNRHMKMAQYWTEQTKRQPPLSVGDHMRIQNQVGSHPLKWDKTGIVIEFRQFDRYAIIVDGSGRVTLRNRRFLRKFEPVHGRRPRFTLDIPPVYNCSDPVTPKTEAPLQDSILPSPQVEAVPEDLSPPDTHLQQESSQSQSTPDAPLYALPPASPQHCIDRQSPVESPAVLVSRRSTRVKKPPPYLADYALNIRDFALFVYVFVSIWSFRYADFDFNALFIIYFCHIFIGVSQSFKCISTERLGGR